jgi:hypothetical protein
MYLSYPKERSKSGMDQLTMPIPSLWAVLGGPKRSPFHFWGIQYFDHNNCLKHLKIVIIKASEDDLSKLVVKVSTNFMNGSVKVKFLATFLKAICR